MRKTLLVLLGSLGLTLALATAAPPSGAAEYGKCGFDSDCGRGGKCGSGKCQR